MPQDNIQFNKHVVGIPALRTLLGSGIEVIVDTAAEQHRQIIKARLAKGERASDKTLIITHTVSGAKGAITFVLWSTLYKAASGGKAGSKIWLKTAIYSETDYQMLQALLTNAGE